MSFLSQLLCKRLNQILVFQKEIITNKAIQFFFEMELPMSPECTVSIFFYFFFKNNISQSYFSTLFVSVVGIISPLKLIVINVSNRTTILSDLGLQGIFQRNRKKIGLCTNHKNIQQYECIAFVLDGFFYFRHMRYKNSFTNEFLRVNISDFIPIMNT